MARWRKTRLFRPPTPHPLLRGDIRFARGNALIPLSKADLDAKFRDCTEGVEGRDQLLHLLTSMEQQNSLNDLKVY